MENDTSAVHFHLTASQYRKQKQQLGQAAKSGPEAESNHKSRSSQNT